MNKKRLKYNLLNEINGLWYDHNELYTGVIFFDKEDYQLEAFEVRNGKIVASYLSPCQFGKKFDSSILIDSSLFCNEDEDIYGSGAVSQLYQGEIYQGMSYTFENGVCSREIYTDKDGYTECKIIWDTHHQQIVTAEIEYEELEPKQALYFYNRASYISFAYFFYHGKEQHIIGADYDQQTSIIDNITIKGNILKTKEYLNFHLPMPEIFDFLDNYQHFKFNKVTKFHLDISNIAQLFEIWIKNNSFLDIESLFIDEKNLAKLPDLAIFNNPSIFPHLQEIRIKDETSEIQIKIMSIKPFFQLSL